MTDFIIGSYCHLKVMRGIFTSQMSKGTKGGWRGCLKATHSIGILMWWNICKVLPFVFRLAIWYKIVGLSDILPEIWKNLGDHVIVSLTSLFDKNWEVKICLMKRGKDFGYPYTRMRVIFKIALTIKKLS